MGLWGTDTSRCTVVIFCTGATIKCRLPTYWEVLWAEQCVQCEGLSGVGCQLHELLVTKHPLCVWGFHPVIQGAVCVCVCVPRVSAVRWALLHGTKEHLPSGAHRSLHCQEMNGKYAYRKITSYIHAFHPLPWKRIRLLLLPVSLNLCNKMFLAFVSWKHDARNM